MRRLRSAQQEQADQGGLWRGQREALRHLMLVALDARTEHLPHQPLLLEQLQRPVHLRLLQRHDRVTRRLLVGGGKGCVERQRIDVRRQLLLLDQAAEHARFDGGEDGKVFAHGFLYPKLPIP